LLRVSSSQETKQIVVRSVKGDVTHFDSAIGRGKSKKTTDGEGGQGGGGGLARGECQGGGEGGGGGGEGERGGEVGADRYF